MSNSIKSIPLRPLQVAKEMFNIKKKDLNISFFFLTRNLSITRRMNH